MSARTIQSALGILQDDPDSEQAWSELREALGLTSDDAAVDPGELGAEELGRLLEAARKAHEMRREYDAVAKLLAIEAALATGEREADLVADLARVLDEYLLDDVGAHKAYERLLALRPGDEGAEEALERSEQKRKKWKDLAQRYFVEAKEAGDAAFKSSLLVSAAEVAYRFARPELEARAHEEAEGGPKTSKKGKKSKDPAVARAELMEKILGLLRDAVQLDPKNRRAAILLERILHGEGRWEELATALQGFAAEVPSKEEKLATLIRLGRVLKKKIGSTERAATAYEQILDLSPGHPEATTALVDYFTEKEKWDELIALYDDQLAGGGVRHGQELGIILQIAMVNWRMRSKPDAAEPYFERVRKLEPAHPGMLSFFREWCGAKGEVQRLVQILSDAQRALPEGPQRSELAAEIATLAEEGANAQKAIEQWRNLLRSDPNNAGAREALKRLYRQSGAFNHLADLLRSELERIPQDRAAERLPVLREIAGLYRDYIKSDSALVTVLSQIIALDPSDAVAVRELARVYEGLGRWRDLLTTQMRLAELETEPRMRAELYRSVARRWLEQFQNVQNAVEAYEKLRESIPDDPEALERLKELYTKRRAYRQLFDLLEVEASRLEGDARRAVWIEMAKLASDRLDRGADALRLYKQIVADNPRDAESLDALERQAERDKDFATVADALEKRAELTDDPNARLALYQKLGGVYSDRLQDHAGALRTWRRVLELSPGHAKALRILRDSYVAVGDFEGLTGLYAESNDWEGLVEVLSATADRVAEPQVKVDLSYRCAHILEEKLKQPERAFRSYERVLGVNPDDQRAAAALVPIYESEEKWARLPALYEVLFAHAADAADKRAILHKLAIVAGTRLADKHAAFGYARRAFELTPDEPSVVRDLEQWARASGEWGGLIEAFQRRLDAPGASADEKRVLRMRLAEISATQAGRAEDAIGAYRELIESNPEDEEAVHALDRLLRAAPDRQGDLRWLFRKRVDRADGDAKIALLTEWAQVEEEVYSAAPEATSVYREILSLDPSRAQALRALARLLVQTGDAEGAVDILVRERDLAEGEARVVRELDLGRLYAGALRKPLEALACARRVLDLSPHDPRAIALLEELLPLAETRASTAILLEEEYAATGAWVKQGEVLAVLIATANSKADRLPLSLRLAEVRQKLGDVQGAFETVSLAAQDNPGSLELWDRLAVLANKTHQTQSFVEAIARAVPPRGNTGLPPEVELDLAERAATLYDEGLGDLDRATPYLERILAKDPSNERAFIRLKQILTTRERWQDLDALYERVIAATEDLARRADLLGEVALIAEEITNDTTRAMHYYERVLELEPGHDQALFALDKLYASHERWQSLADLLVRRIEAAGDADTTQLEMRVGTLLMNRLENPKAALDHLEKVVVADSSIREARDMVERCLAHPDLRQRAATILEGVYLEREEMRDVVRVLEVRLEFVTDETERRELLRRIAELRDDRLTDDRGAFDTYAKLIPLSPGDVDARQRYLHIARRLDRMDAAADVLLMAARNAESPQPRAEILGEVAKIYEDAEEHERAEMVHRQVLDLAPDDPSIALPATRSLERGYTARGKHKELVQVLEIQVKLEEDAQIRRELLARIGQLSEKELGDDAAAIAVWKQRLEDDPADEAALEALDRLYERSGDTASLVEILRARERLTDAAEQRKSFMLRIAQILAARESERAEAILAYRAVLDDFGADRAVLEALTGLYEKAEQWQDLAESLETQLGIATDTADRVALMTRLGDVRRKRLGEVAESLDVYREALTLDPSNEAARKALEELLDDDNVRRDAADILRPLYEATGDDARLLRVLDIQIAAEEGLPERLELLARASGVCEGPLADFSKQFVQKAFAYTSRGLKEAAGDASIGEWIERAERIAARGGTWADLVQLYRDVAPEVLDEDRQVELWIRVAELARAQLSDAELAKEHYKKALEQRPEDARALTALESLYEQSAEHEALLDVLRRRAELADSDDAKREILYRQAKICDEVLADRDRAIAIYEAVLELGFDPPAIAALERLYTAASRWGDLVALHERELSADGTTRERRAALHHALGRLYERELSDMERAFEEYAAALGDEPTHEPTIASLETLMQEKTHAGRAAEMLEAVYLARLDGKKVMIALEARLEASQDPDERRTLLRRLAKLHEEQEENYRAALDVTAKLLSEDVTDEATWAELERLARVANAEERLAEIFAAELEKITADEPATARLAFRTGELFEMNKRDEQALAFYRRAYDFAREDEQRAFGAIDRLLARTGKPAERAQLYRDALEYRTEPADRAETLHVIAKIEEEELKDDELAIVTFRSILDVDETDASALDALARLYGRREKWRDLADLSRRRAEQSALPEDEAKWRLELAKVSDEKLSETEAAIDELATVIGLVSPQTSPTGSAAVAVLEAMVARDDAQKPRVVEMLRPVYEQADSWQKLVELGKHRFAIAEAPNEKVAVLRDTARLLEGRGKDVGAAFTCVKDAFVLDPDDGDTREELDRLAVATSRWDDLAEAYEQGIAKIDGIGQRELLEALARLHDKRRDDPRKALDAWERLFKLDETDTRPLDEIDQLATLLSDWLTLVRVLAKRAEMTNDDEERASLWRRIGEARRDMLDDAPGAIDAYERALELEPESAWTLDNLIPLYEAKSDAARLVALYRRRIELCGEDDGDLRHRLLVDSAKCYEVGLGDRREAIALLGQALAMKAGDPEVMAQLAGLFEAEKMWPELLDNLRAQVEGEPDAAKKAQLTKQIGRLLAKEQGDSDMALAAYREVLAHGYDEEAARAVREIGDSRDELRREAADILEPVLRAAEKHEDLVGALQMRLRAQTEASDRAATLRQIAVTCEASLGDLSRAMEALLEAFAVQATDADLHAEIERVAGLLGRPGWERYADALSDRAASIFEAKVTADLFTRLGKVAETELADLARAAEAYAKAAEQGGDSPEVLAALERVHAGRSDTKALVEVLERRIGLETDPAAQAELYHRLASLQLDAVGDKPQALATLKLALDRVPAHDASREAVERLLGEDALFDEAFETLERVYRATGRGADLARLYGRRVDRAEAQKDKTRARLDHARVLEQEANDPSGSQRVLEAAIVEDLVDDKVLEELERLATRNNHWTQAADALARALDAADKAARSQSSPSLSAAAAGHSKLWARLGMWRRDKVEDYRSAEIAFIKALDGDPENIELVRAVEDMTRAPGRERDRIAVLRRLARLEGEPDKKREVTREAADIAENVLADPRLAEEILRELLAQNEADAWGMEELTRLREEMGDHLEVVGLLLRRAEAEQEAEKAIALRHRAADVAAEKLNDKDRAIGLYEGILEQEPGDARAQERLRALYTELEKWPELAKLLRLLVDNAPGVAERAALRISLAELQDTKFEAPKDAVDTLRAIREEDPDHDGAATALVAIFERTAQDGELADLQAQLVERARARGDSALELARMVRLGEILEERVKDSKRALETYEAVLEREASHTGALEAVARLAESRAAWDKAATALSRLVEGAAGAEAVALALRLAKARDEQGDMDGFEQALRRALDAEPRNAEVRERLGKLFEKTSKWADLASLVVGDADHLEAEHGPYEPAAAGPMSIAPGARPGAAPASIPPPPAHVADQVALLRRAAEIHLNKRSEPGDAVPLLERATKLVPNDRELLLLLCDAYTASKRERDAATVLEKIISSFGQKRTKELSIYHHKLGRALASLGDKDVALAQLDMAFKIDPGSVEVLRDLGVLALEANDLDRAQKTFRALLLQKLDPNSGISKGEVFYYLGEVSMKQGDKAKAIQMLERAVENDPNLARAKSMLTELKG